MSISKSASLKTVATVIPNGTTYGDGYGFAFANVVTSLTVVPASSSGDLSVRVDGDPDSSFTIPSGQAFKSSAGDFQCNSIDFANSSGSDITLQVLAGVSQ